MVKIARKTKASICRMLDTLISYIELMRQHADESDVSGLVNFEAAIVHCKNAKQLITTAELTHQKLKVILLIMQKIMELLKINALISCKHSQKEHYEHWDYNKTVTYCRRIIASPIS